MQLQEKYPDQLVAISWNLDHNAAGESPSPALQQSVLAKLVALDIRCLNVICSDPMDAVFERHDIFAPPVVLVYGRDGALVKKFEGAFSYAADVQPLVETLLTGSG